MNRRQFLNRVIAFVGLAPLVSRIKPKEAKPVEYAPGTVSIVKFIKGGYWLHTGGEMFWVSPSNKVFGMDGKQL